jgi:F0F1-type ATP synthase assembly protein I
MYRKPVSLKRRAIYSFGLGCGIFLLGVALRALLDNLGVSGMTALIDDLLIGILAGVLVFAYERHQHKLILAIFARTSGASENDSGRNSPD